MIKNLFVKGEPMKFRIALKKLSFLVVAVLLFLYCDSCSTDGGTYYTVSFDSNGGSFISAQSVENGKCAVEPEAPTKDGHVFSAWYSENNKFVFSTPITSDIILTAKWEKPQIYLSCQNLNVIIGKNLSFNISFDGFSEIPTEVDVYKDDESSVFLSNVPISNGTISVSLSGVSVGQHTIYVKAKNFKSNILSVSVLEEETVEEKILNEETSDKETSAEETSVGAVKIIYLTCDNISLSFYESAVFTVVFKNFTEIPNYVDVYKVPDLATDEGTIFLSNVPVIDGKISVPLEGISFGLNGFYVKTATVKSTKIFVNIKGSYINLRNNNRNIYLGETAVFDVEFDNFKESPSTVDVYEVTDYDADESSLFLSDVPVSNGTISIDGISLGHHWFYITSRNLKSNKSDVLIQENNQENNEVVATGRIDLTDSGNGRYLVGQTATFNVAFKNFEETPNSVDIYADGEIGLVASDAAITNGTVSLPIVDDFEGQNINFYVKSGDITSNKIEIEIKQRKITLSSAKSSAIIGETVQFDVAFENFVATPNAVTVYIGDKENPFKTDVPISDEGISVSTSELENSSKTSAISVAYEKFASNEISMNFEARICTITFVDSENPSHVQEQVISESTETLKTAQELGFAKKYDEFIGWTEDASTAEIVYTDGANIEISENKTLYPVYKPNFIIYLYGRNQIHVYSTAIVGADVYYSTTNDISTATLWGTLPYRTGDRISFTLKESGTYYFWIGSSLDNHSGVISMEFIHQDLVPPVIVNGGASSNISPILIVWEVGAADRASAYWIYYNKTNDLATAQCVKRLVFDEAQYRVIGADGRYQYTFSRSELQMQSGVWEVWYFWMKAADDITDDSPTSDFSKYYSYYGAEE